MVLLVHAQKRQDLQSGKPSSATATQSKPERIRDNEHKPQCSRLQGQSSGSTVEDGAHLVAHSATVAEGV